MPKESEPNKYPEYVPYNPGFSSEDKPNGFDRFLRGSRQVGLAILVGYVVSENVNENSELPVTSADCDGKQKVTAGTQEGSNTFELLGEKYVVSSGDIPRGVITDEIRAMNPRLERASDVPGSVVSLPISCKAE